MLAHNNNYNMEPLLQCW